MNASTDPEPKANPNNNAEGQKVLDPFDPSRLRLNSDFASAIGVKKALRTVPVRKPSKEWWVRTHPDEEYRLETAVIELKEDRETYLVNSALWPELSTIEATFGPRAIFTAINRQKVVFLWLVRMPGQDGRLDDWSESAMEAADLARDQWVRVQANMSLGAYEVLENSADLPDPEWPTESFQQLLHIGFRDRYIDSLDHDVLRRLRGTS